jgi:hypothetical protein
MNTLRPVSILFTLLLLAGASQAQRARIINATLSDDSVAARAKQINDPTFVPHGSRVYVADITGLPAFENNLVAAFQKKQVDLIVVADRSLADFEVNGFAETEKANWAKIIFSRGLPESEASIQLVNLRTNVVAYAVASYKVEARNGNKSTAEHLAKNLRQKMDRDDKRISRK